MRWSTTWRNRVLDRLRLADLSPDQFSKDVAKRLRSEQIRGTIQQMRVMVPCNTLFAPALSFQAWNSGVNGLIILWTTAIICFSWWLFFNWRRVRETDGSPEDMRRFLVEAFVNSAFWAVGMALFYPLVEGDQKTIVTTIMAGSLAIGTVGYVRAPAAAITYLSVQTAGNASVAFATGFHSGSTTDLLVALLSLAAGASLFNAVAERGKAAIIAFKNLEQLSEKSEVIDLLLKDYEEQATEWLWQTDAQGRILSAPIQIMELLGVRGAHRPTISLTKLISKKSTPESISDVRRLQVAFDRQSEFHDIHISILDPFEGTLRWIVMKGRPQLHQGQFRGFRGIFADATVAVEAERQVQYLASHDSLTDLHNRNTVQRSLAQLDPEDSHAIALLIDLDGFKQVNDSYGHHIGDLLLRAVADRLRRLQSPDVVVSRLGGDEFFVLITGIQAVPGPAPFEMADDIVKTLSRPFHIQGFDLQVSASVGIAHYPANTQKGAELLLMADLALYEAKNSGRNRSMEFQTSMQRAHNERLVVTERLKNAVRNGGIRRYYQPQYRLSDGKLIGFEALARWYDDQLGSIGPDIFIPIAEQTGLIVELGEQMLRGCCSDAAQWAQHGVEDAPIASVNLSPVQFSSIDIVDLVARTLQQTGLAAGSLEIEVTEGVLISDKARVTAALKKLAAMGVSIALDDFGTGYSSLSYLKDLPLNRLKIDRTFVSDLHHGVDNPIVKTIIQLARSLNLSVIAEGIETSQQAQLLIDLNCDDGQGFLYGRPVPFAATFDILARDRARRTSAKAS